MERKIIDVSKHQGAIDWTKVKGNIDGAIIRCGYGSDIANQDDTQFKANVEGCIANNIPFGTYLYSYAKTLADAKSEANHVLRLITPYKALLSYPVYLDLEEAGTETGAVERAVAFCNILEEQGYTCGIYANQNWWQNYLKNGLDEYTKWVAKYSSSKPTGISGTYDMWQYSSTEKVPGISGNVDMSICYKAFGSTTASSTTSSAATSTSAAASTSSSTASAASSKTKITSNVKSVQTWLNTYYKTGLTVDGIYGTKTKSALVKAWQTEVGNLAVDGIFGTASKAAGAAHIIKKGTTGILVTIWQAYLVCRGYNPNGIDGIFGTGCHNSTISFQKANSLSQDGIVGKNTWYAAFH